MWGFPKIRGTFLGVPILRIIVFWGLYWDPLISGNHYVELSQGKAKIVIRKYPVAFQH